MRSIVWPNPNQKVSNLLDGGSGFYTCYETSDGKFMALGAIEPQFFARFKQILTDAVDSNDIDFDLNELNQFDDDLKAKLDKAFRLKTRDQWTQLFLHQDACCTPVLEIDESPNFDHFVQRNSFFIDKSPVPFPRPIKRQTVDNSPAESAESPRSIDQNTLEVLLEELQLTSQQIQQLITDKIVSGQSKLWLCRYTKRN